MRSGQIDAISNLDPVITLLTRSNDLRIVSDTRVVAEADRELARPPVHDNAIACVRHHGLELVAKATMPDAEVVREAQRTRPRW